MLSNDFHIESEIDQAYLDELHHAIRRIGKLVQMVDVWDDPKQFKRVWLLLECLIALDVNADLLVCLFPTEEARLVQTLAAEGPVAVLRLISQLEVKVEKTVSRSKHAAALRAYAQMLIDRNGGVEEVRLKLLERFRVAFANCADESFRRRTESMDTWDSAAFDTAFQLAELFAMTNEADRAEQLFSRYLDHSPLSDPRRSRCAAALGRLLRRLGRDADAHEAELRAANLRHCAVSWQVHYLLSCLQLWP